MLATATEMSTLYFTGCGEQEPGTYNKPCKTEVPKQKLNSLTRAAAIPREPDIANVRDRLDFVLNSVYIQTDFESAKPCKVPFCPAFNRFFFFYRFKYFCSAHVLDTRKVSRHIISSSSCLGKDVQTQVFPQILPVA